MKTVLVVDDELRIAQIARDYFEKSEYRVVIATTGRDALSSYQTEHPDLVVLDLGLPDINGLDVTRALRKIGNTPIIILTARGEETDKLVGLELGADDYMVKPFSPKELVARARAVLRRAESTSGDPAHVLQVDDLSIDPSRMRVTLSGQQIELTITEFQLLHTLASQPGRIFTRAQLLDAVRGMAVESYERAIDAHIKNLRRKIEPEPRDPRYIHTVYGVGYKFAD